MDFIVELFYKGGWLMWPILFQGILSISIFFERVIFLSYSKLSEKDLETLLEKFFNSENKEDILENKNIKFRVNENIQILKAYEMNDLQRRESAIERVVEIHVKKLSKRLDVLLLNGQIAPLFGLLGTVLGMIETFQRISTIDTPLTPSLIAGGIWVAMLTTAFGLIVAIPSYIFYAILERIMKNRIDLMNFVLHILEEKDKEIEKLTTK